MFRTIKKCPEIKDFVNQTYARARARAIVQLLEAVVAGLELGLRLAVVAMAFLEIVVVELGLG